MSGHLVVMNIDNIVMCSLYSESNDSMIFGRPDQFDSPMTTQDLEDLQWYLEEYLNAPFAFYLERGVKIKSKLKVWGERLFASLFGEDKSASTIYYFAKTLEKGEIEIVLSSSSQEFLGLPWELIHDPDDQTPLAFQFNGIIRRLHKEDRDELSPACEPKAGEVLRILLVVARPFAAQDAPYQLIASSLLNAIQPLADRIKLDMVRPPTFEELERMLEDALEREEPYHILHFDGHGSIQSATGGENTESPDSPYLQRQGFLVFEREHPGIGIAQQGRYVSAIEFADVIKRSAVPVVILNACQSATLQKGMNVSASVATRLLEENISGVVAMSYAIYTNAAAAFMGEFYKALFEGKGVAEAVTRGRIKLYESNLRPSSRGQEPLEDWFVPVYYSQQEVSFPELKAGAISTAVEAEDNFESNQASISVSAWASGLIKNEALAPYDGLFIGRSGEIREIDRNMRRFSGIILSGMRGTGKTELVKAYARWLIATNALQDPNLVSFCYFDPTDADWGVDAFLAELGAALCGSDFPLRQTTRPSRQRAILEFIEQNQSLIILDNFDHLLGIDEAASAQSMSSQQDREELIDFLQDAVRRTRGGIMITGRSLSYRLNDDFLRFVVTGLSWEDSNNIMARLLSDTPQSEPLRTDTTLAHLMEFSRGNPQVLRFIASQLDHISPAELLEILLGKQEPTEPVKEELDKLISLEEFRKAELPSHIFALAMFDHLVATYALPLFSDVRRTPARFKSISRETWQKSLSNCMELGLICMYNDTHFQIHPLLPLRCLGFWRDVSGDSFENEYEEAWVANIRSHALQAQLIRDDIKGGNPEVRMLELGLQHSMFEKAADEALARRLYREAIVLLSTLDLYWTAHRELGRVKWWAARCRALLETVDQKAPDISTDAGELWVLMVGSEANQLLISGDLKAAEKIYLELLHEFEKVSDLKMIALNYHNLGICAEWRGELDLAEEYIIKELEILEKEGDESGSGKAYQQLGTIYIKRDKMDEAESYFKKSLETKERAGDKQAMATTLLSLGELAIRRQDINGALEWIKKGQDLSRLSGLKHELAISYQLEADIARTHGKLEEAEELYNKALTTFELIDSKSSAGEIYRSLGALARDRGDLVAAAAWFEEALKYKLSIEDKRDIADLFSYLGETTFYNDDWEAAGKWYGEALKALEELDDQPEIARACAALGNLALQKNENVKAKGLFERCLKIELEQGNKIGVGMALHNLGTVYHKEENLVEAEKKYTEALRIWEELNSVEHLATTIEMLGYVEYQSERPERSLNWIIRRIALLDEIPHPDMMAGPIRHLAKLMDQLGADAIEDCWKVVTDSPFPNELRSSVFLSKASSAYTSNMPDEALEWAVRAISVFDEFPHPFLSNGQIFLAADLTNKLGMEAFQKSWQKVTGTTPPSALVDAIEQSIKQNKSKEESPIWDWYHRGSAMYSMSYYEEAIRCYRKALALNPNFLPALEWNAKALVALGHYEEAIDYLDRVLVLDTDSLEALKWRGISLAEIGRYEQALISFDRILEIKPDLADGFYNKACLFALQGKNNQAFENLQKAFSLDPDTTRKDAKTDPTLNRIRDDDRFHDLING